MNRLPSLNAIRAFDAAARHLTFTRAAEELHVTHGAISRQILALEKALNTLLFVRGPRGLTLTPEGVKLSRSTGAAFQMLHVAFEQLSAATATDGLRLNVPPTFAMRWLIPRLGALHRSHPGLRLEISTSIEPVERADDRYDAAIRRVDRAPKGWVTTRFLDGQSIPVCSPGFRKRHGLRVERDLADAMLIVTGTESRAWDDWLRRHGVKRRHDAPTLRLAELYFSLQAALDSLGVALVPLAIVADELRLGGLVALAGPDPAVRRDYALLSPRLSSKREAIGELADWLRLAPASGTSLP